MHDALPAARMTAPWRVSVLMRGGATRASSILARRGADVAIFDTGMAHHAASFRAALLADGLSPEDVTLVFNTHAHVDHSHNNALFPRARLFCSARDREWTRAFHAALSAVDHPGPADVAPFYPEIATSGGTPKFIRKVVGIEKMLWDESRWGSLAQVAWLEQTTLPPGITLLDTPGHSPDHVSFVIETGDRPVLVCGDALLLRDEAVYEAPMMPPWSTALYRRSQDRIFAFDGLIVPGHDEPFDNRPQNTISKPPAK
jgi:glyoxylase-like metal-dependent hydrolase (beta-lactamase superfamily II)